MKRLTLENLSSASEIRKTLLTVPSDYPDYDFTWLMPIIASAFRKEDL